MIRVRFYNGISGFVISEFQWNDGRITSDRYRMIIQEIFYLCAESIDNRKVIAVVDIDGDEVFYMIGNVKVDGSSIYCNVTIGDDKKYKMIRRMVIAE